MKAPGTVERWRVDAGDADIATLDIPPALGRARRFEVDVRLQVRCPADAAGATHALTVEVDGRREWSRQVATHNPGASDGLDYRFRIEVPEGSALRVRAIARVRGAQRQRLLIEADET